MCAWEDWGVWQDYKTIAAAEGYKKKEDGEDNGHLMMTRPEMEL